jgi:hypothetical protein
VEYDGRNDATAQFSVELDARAITIAESRTPVISDSAVIARADPTIAARAIGRRARAAERVANRRQKRIRLRLYGRYQGRFHQQGRLEFRWRCCR